MSMKNTYLYPLETVLSEKATGPTIPLRLMTTESFKESGQHAIPAVQAQMDQTGFSGKAGQLCIVRDGNSIITEILAGASFPLSLYALSVFADKIRKELSDDFIKNVSFFIDQDLSVSDANQAALGWALAGYKFDRYKKDKHGSSPTLLWPKQADQTRVRALAEGLCLIRNLINTPANDLGTDELADAARQIASSFKAGYTRIADKDLLEKNFPMIYDVGKASPRRPQLIDITWGDDKHPHVTLVGKGIVFDTGGLDLKPPPFMLLMKKDMGGAAHVLGLAHAIMSLNLPIRLRVLLSIAENSTGSASFRPGDILKSRKGLSVEVGDTDAEGRLVVADALTYACEESRKPDLLVDFTTLTGSARAALGYDIPAIFSNRDDVAEELKQIGMANEDPVWPLPLWQPYLKEMNSPVADINNIGSGKAGALHGGLFLQQFIDNAVDWIHIDCYAWEQSGKPGRPAGGADTGMRAVLQLIEKRFC